MNLMSQEQYHYVAVLQDAQTAMYLFEPFLIYSRYIYLIHPIFPREQTNKRRVKEIVKEFSLLCRGLQGTTGYSADY